MYKNMCVKGLDPYSLFCCSKGPTVPNENQMRMMSAVRGGINNGSFYDTDMFAFVKNSLNDIINENILSQGSEDNIRTENNYFGYDIYCARKVVENNMIHEANIQACKSIVLSGLITIGQRFKKLYYGGMHFSTVTINSINLETGMICMNAKRRGTKGTWELSIGANETRLLALIMEGVVVGRVLKTVTTTGTTIVINPYTSRQALYKSQVNISM